MKILVVCQYYAPEPFRVSDLCEELVRRGHDITVVTGVPNYPEGRIYPGYERGQKRDEEVNGVRVHRCWTIPRGSGVIRRFLNYCSFALSSRCYVCSRDCVASDGGLFDVVFVNQLSPVMMAEAAIAFKKKHHIPSILYCLDLWPESLTVGGIRKNSRVYRLFHRISGRIYAQMDRILVTSRTFRSYLRDEFGIVEEKTDYLPQYAESLFENLPESVPDGQAHLVFAGNIGAAQDVDTILRAAVLLRDEPVRFHIVGGGSELNRLQASAMEESLSNVVFHGRRPIEEMPSFYAIADAMLVTLRADPVLSRTLPGKVQSYMAAGKPILGAIDGETNEVIRAAACGYCGPAEDADALAENIRRFITTEDRAILGQNARAYYEAHFDRERFMDALERELVNSESAFDQ